MSKLVSKFGFKKEHSSPYYLQANGQVEAVNKSLKTILQCIVNKSKSNWILILYLMLWAYQTSFENATGFSPFQIIHGVEEVMRIACEILSLKITIELLPDTTDLEACLIHLE
jgi:hypothetical protein